MRCCWLLTGGDWALAEDLAQTAISQVWRHWNRVSVMEAPEAYAHKVMVSTFLSWRRGRWMSEISTERFVVPPATTGGIHQGGHAYIPTPLGPSGVKVMLPLFKFPGTNPANWTSSPLVK